MKRVAAVELAKQIRIHAVKMVNKGGSSHIGSILSIADVLAVLYGLIMKFRPNDPLWDGRDRFILSKGHAGAGVYAVLAECGFFGTNMLMKHCQNGSEFSGHVSHKGVAGVEFSTGSLGHGLSVGCGMAYAGKLDEKGHRVFVLMSDGELDEGSNWEAILFASHYNLNNLTAIIDRNRLQGMDNTEATMALEPLVDKFEAFGWNVHDIDGHDIKQLEKKLSSMSLNKPSVIITNTVKGKGVTYMENNNSWHYKTPQNDLFRQALSELSGK